MLTLHQGRRAGTDEGFAIVIALLVTAIAFLIMTAVLAQAIHNVVLAGHGRRRVMAVNAAEAGLNWYSNLLSTSSLVGAMDNGLGWTAPSGGCPSSGLSSCWYVLGPTNATTTARVTVANKPELATFELRVLLLSKNPCTDAAGAATRCTLGTVAEQLTVWDSNGAITQQGVLKAADTAATPWPDTAYMVVRSTGIVGTVRRTLESYVRLRATRTGVPGGFVAEAVCLGTAAKLIVNGDFSIADQAAARTSAATSTAFDSNCRNGNLEVDSGDSLELRAFSSAGGTLQIRGGGLWVDRTSRLVVQNDVWAEGAVTLGTGATTGSCPTSSGVQCVQGDAIGSSVIVGSNAYVAGNTITCSPVCPPVLTFPHMTWNASDWSDPWSIQTVTSTSNLLDLMEVPTTPTVYHVVGGAPACNLSFARSNASGGEVLLKTKIAVVSECQFSFRSSSASILPAATDAALLLISAWPSSGSPACGSPTGSSIGPHDVELNQNPTIETGFFVYTPCFLWIGNNQNPLSGDPADFIQGQFAGRFVRVDQQVTLTQVNIGNLVATLPGQLTGFKQDVKFVREILSSIAAGNQVL